MATSTSKECVSISSGVAERLENELGSVLQLFEMQRPAVELHLKFSTLRTDSLGGLMAGTKVSMKARKSTEIGIVKTTNLSAKSYFFRTTNVAQRHDVPAPDMR
jgi:hypothetical protein